MFPSLFSVIEPNHVDMWGRMSTTGVGPARSVDRAEDTVGVVLCVLFEIVLAIFGTASHITCTVVHIDNNNIFIRRYIQYHIVQRSNNF